MKKLLFPFTLLLTTVLGYTQNQVTITQLRALTSATANQQFYITDAGRQGLVQYISADVSSPDDNGTVFVSSNGLRFKRLNFRGQVINPALDTVYVTWFGAIGDSTFDNTDIFEDIIARNFKHVHIPDGQFRIVRTSLNNANDPAIYARGLMVRANQKWTGNGTHRSIVIQDGITNDVQSTYYHLFNVQGGLSGGALDTCDNVEFRNFTIRGKNYNWSIISTLEDPSAIFFYVSASHAVIDSMKIEYVMGQGIVDFANGYLKGGYNKITNCVIRYTGRNGLNINSPYAIITGNLGEYCGFGLLEASTGHSIIANNIARFNNLGGFAVGGYGDTTEAKRDGGYNLIYNNTSYGNGTYGMSLSAGTSYSLVFNNTLHYNRDPGLQLSELQSPGVVTRNNYIFGNTIYDNGQTGAGGSSSPIGVYLDADQNRVYNNTIYRTGTNVPFNGKTYSQQQGLLTYGSKNSLIANNNIYGHTSAWGELYLSLGQNMIWMDTGYLAGKRIRMSVTPNGATPRTWSQVYGSLTISDVGAYDPDISGIDPNTFHTLQLQYGASLLDSITLITTRPPTIELGADTTVVNSLADRILTSTASDADGTIAGYQWHIMRRPFGSTSTLTNATTATVTINNLAYGEYYLMCEVTDNRGSKGADYRYVNVSPSMTIAQLRALTSSPVGQVYWITDANRQGYVQYDNTDNTSTDNNGTIFVSGNGLRFKRLNFRGEYIDPALDTVYVTWFGAVGDSTFDNTDIFEAIIGRNFKRIHIPDGIYRINFSSLNNFNGPDSKFRGLMLRANQRWTGNGTHRSVVLMDGVVNDNPSTYYSLFSGHGGGAIDTCDNVTFRGFTIRGKNYGGVPTNTINEAIGIYQGWSASHFTVDSMKFEYIYGHGHADFATFGGKFGWNTVTNNIYLFNGKNGANLNTPDLIFTGNYGRKNIFSLLEAATGRAIIMNNIAEENDFIGIAVGGHGDSLEAVNNGRYNIVANNLTFGNKQRGIHLAGGTSYSLVFNNTSYYNGAYGIGVTEDFTNLDLGPNQIATRNNYVFNNVSYDNGEVGNPSPMGVYLLASENRIFNNTIYRTGALTWRGRNFDQKWGIISEATKGNHQVFNNTIYGSHSLGDYYYRVGNNLVWTDTTRLTTPHNPTFIVSVDPFANNSPFLWTQVFGSLNMSAPTGYNNALTGIDPNSTHTLRLAYNGGADSITFITTRPPTIELGADTTINSLSNISLNSTASDADGSVAGYQWHIMRQPYLSTSALVNATSATVTLNNLAVGDYYLMCEVTDNTGAKGVDYRVVHVVSATVVSNIPPTANAGPDQTITLPTNQVTLNASGSTDPDGTIASYSWTKLSGTGGTITSPTASSTTVTGLTQGVYVFRLLITDNLGASDDDTVQVTVNAPAGITYATWNPSDKESAITLSNGNLSAQGVMSNVGGVRSTISKSSGKWYWEYKLTTLGTGGILGTGLGVRMGIANGTLDVETTRTGDDINGIGLQDYDGWTFQSSILATSGSQFSLNTVLGVALDMDAGTLRLYQNGVDLGIVKTGLTGSWFASWGYSGATTTYTANFGASPFDYPVPNGFNAGLYNVSNQMPTANAGLDQVISLPTTQVTLSGSGTDPDGTIVGYSWTKLTGTGGTITSPTSASTTVTGLSAGNYTFRLVVTDNNGGTDDDTVAVFVNTPPTVSAGPDVNVPFPQSQATLTAVANDIDGSVVSYSWTQLSGFTTTITTPSSASTSVTGLGYSFTPFVYVVTVTDNNGAVGRDTVNIAVSFAPVASAGTDQFFNLPQNQTTLMGLATDGDGNISSIVWTKLTGGAATIVTPGNDTTLVTGLQAGVYTFRIAVTDATGFMDDDTVQVIVNAPPIANAGSDIVITLPNTTTTLTGSGSSDPDGTIVAYNWQKVSGPGSNPTSPLTANTGVTGLSEGVYLYRLRVTDNYGVVSFDTVQITVQPGVGVNSYVVRVQSFYNYSLQAWITFDDYSLLKVTQSGGGSPLTNLWKRNEIVDGVRRPVAYLRFQDGTQRIIKKKGD